MGFHVELLNGDSEYMSEIPTEEIKQMNNSRYSSEDGITKDMMKSGSIGNSIINFCSMFCIRCLNSDSWKLKTKNIKGYKSQSTPM